MAKTITIKLPNHRGISWNFLYKTPHWAYRQQIARQIHELMQAALVDLGFDPFSKLALIKRKVDIAFEAVYKSKEVDCDNLCTKLYIDGLKGILLIDDNPNYVHQVSSRCTLGEESFVQLTIQEL